MYQKLLNLSLALTLVVITLGALTRLLDAGLGCPDWPGCYGQLTPPANWQALSNEAAEKYADSPLISHQAWMEMIHRYAAGALGLLIAFITFLAFKTKQAQRIKITSVVLSCVVIAQAVFGMWTVTLKLWPPIVTIHLLGGFATLSLLILLKVWSSKHSIESLTTAPSINSKMVPDNITPIKALIPIAFLVLFIQITLGAWTSSNYAGLACPDFPTCQNQWLPDISVQDALTVPEYQGLSFLHGLADAKTRVSIQYLHRLGALITLLVLGSLIVKLWQSGIRHFKYLACYLGFTLSSQILLGILAAVLLLPLPIALLHNTGAALTLSGLIYLIALVSFPVKTNAFSSSSLPLKEATHGRILPNR